MRLFGAKGKVTGSDLPAEHRPPKPTPAAAPADGASLDSRPAPLPGLAPSAEDQATGHRLLFVGGEVAWFRAVERELVQRHPDWVSLQVASGQQALETLSFDHFDVLVLDGRLAGGPALLAAFKTQHPAATCLVRCNLWDRVEFERWLRLGATPVEDAPDGASLAGSLDKAERLRVWMADPAIQKLLPQMRTLPTMPELHADVMEQLSSPNIPLENVARLISQDPVMTAKVLQVVNSTRFGLAYQVSDPAEAVLFLGTERTRSLVLLAGVFSKFDAAQRRGFATDKIWVHSLQVGWLARRIVLEETRTARLAEAAFTAGLLHDIGKLLLAGNLPELYQTVQQTQARKGGPPREAEFEVFGTTHAELGACLLGTWGLALPILEAIAFHHHPARSSDTTFSLLTAVHAANVFAHEAGFGSSTVRVTDGLSHEYLARLDLANRAAEWRTACGVPA